MNYILKDIERSIRELNSIRKDKLFLKRKDVIINKIKYLRRVK